MAIIMGMCFAARAQGTKAFDVKVTGKGQPVLFIPGATCGGSEWDETVAHLKGSKYQCHVFTLAGYAGTAPMAEGPFLEKYKNEIKQYIVSNKLEHVIIVGHSIGGFLGIWIASEMKDHLQKVVVVDALPFLAAVQTPNPKTGFDETAAKGMLERYNKMDSAQMIASQKMVAGYMCLDSTKWNKIAMWGQQSDKKTMAYSMMEMMGNDLRGTIAKITVPVLVMDAWAPNAQYPQFTKEYALQTYADQYKECKTCTVHITDHSKHFIMYDEPTWFYKELDTFIAAN